MSGGEEESAEDWLRRQIEAYHVSALAYAAVKLDLPDRMAARAWTADELAAEMRLSPPHLLRVLRGLASLGLCAEDLAGSFTLTRLGQALHSGSLSRLAEKVTIVTEQYWAPWANLPHSLQTGAPAFEHVFGTDVWAWRNENFGAGDGFAAYLAGETFAGAGAIVEALDLTGVGTVADVGGGRGGLLAALLQAHPGISGILFDLPETIIGAKKFLRSHGVAERVTLVGGDFLAEVPVEADLYLLKAVLQHWDDAAVRAILESCREAMKPQARLVIIESLLPKHAIDAPGAVMADLHMMVINGGRVRSLEQFAALLSQAGLSVSRAVATSSGLTLIEAIPA